MSRRIRTIKPEWLEDELLALASSDARVLSVALVLLADDEGRGRASPVMLAGQVFPGKPLDVLANALEELTRIRYVVLYEVEGQHYFAIRNWDKHQKIDRPTPSKLPAPQDTCGVRANTLESSTSDREEETKPRSARARAFPSASSPGPGPSHEGVQGEGNPPSRVDLAGRPLPRKPLLPEMVQRDDYHPSQPMLAYGSGLGLVPEALDGVLRDLRDKHGLRPHTLDWWDERWLRFAESARGPRTRGGQAEPRGAAALATLPEEP